MEEKYIINDILENSKNIVIEYADIITSTMNMELRQTLQNIRNTAENLQYELKKLAETKGYSILIDEVTLDELKKVNLIFRT